MPPRSMVRLLLVISIATCDLSTVRTLYRYRGANVTLDLNKNQPMSLDFYGVGVKEEKAKHVYSRSDLIGRVLLSSNGTEVKADRWNDTAVMRIEFKEPFVGTNVTLMDTSINIKVVMNSSDGYWRMTDLNLTFEGTMMVDNVTRKPIAARIPLMSAQKTGASPHRVDRICSSGYSICAPLSLCWRCDRQVLSANLSAMAEEHNFTVELIIPGMKFTPFNETGHKTVYSWDCDPILDVRQLEALMVTILLLVIFMWANELVSTIQTPDRFDNPNGKLLSVHEKRLK